MGLLKRNLRSLQRDVSGYRDDRLFIIACDDTYAPKQYFDFFKIPRVQIHVIPTTAGDSAARHVLERLLSIKVEDYDERWLVLDTDHCTSGSHLPGFLEALSEAKQNGIKIALSKPCFELWLLLHHIEVEGVISLRNAREVEEKMREMLGGYNKTNLKAEHYPASLLINAYERAESLARESGGGFVPSGNTTQVFMLWKSIIEESISSQLPKEFRPLVLKLRPALGIS